jgi:hypothetical protein
MFGACIFGLMSALAFNGCTDFSNAALSDATNGLPILLWKKALEK